jgi:uncharacterized protein DUF4169
MTADIVNLRRLRKAKLRAEREVHAEENCLKHGRPRKERDRQAAEVALAKNKLDGHKRQD